VKPVAKRAGPRGSPKGREELLLFLTSTLHTPLPGGERDGEMPLCVCSDGGERGRHLYRWYQVSNSDECQTKYYELATRYGEELGYIECRYIG